MTTTEKYLTTAELAEETGKTADFWARACKSGAIPAVKLGNDWRVADSVFRQYMRTGGAGGGAIVARPGRLSSRGRRRSSG